MSDDTSGEVPALSLLDGTCDPDRFAASLGRAFERFGFAIVADHGIPQQLIDRAWRETRAVFALSTETKCRYRLPGAAGVRGYTPFGTEMAKDASITDLKEFWHVGREPSVDQASAAGPPPNVWPTEIPGFEPTVAAMFTAFERVGDILLSAIARHLGLAPDWFVAATTGGNSLLRLLHYPPVSADAPGVRAGAHEDIDLITLLLGAEEAGLELRDRDGRWLPIRPPEGALVVNVGDMLQRLTNHVLPSTTHRVVNPAPDRRGTSRYSMPFFLHPRSDFLIETLPECITPENPNRYPVGITEHDFLNERLVAIGLKPG